MLDYLDTQSDRHDVPAPSRLSVIPPFRWSSKARKGRLWAVVRRRGNRFGVTDTHLRECLRGQQRGSLLTQVSSNPYSPHECHI